MGYNARMDPATLARLALLAATLAISGVNTKLPPPLLTPTSDATTRTTYVTQAGDTLYAIALKFNTTVAALQQANQITNPNALTVGQTLIIPGAPGASSATAPSPNPSRSPPTAAPTPSFEIYLVRAGDTLAQLAAQFGVSLQELMRVNQITNPNLLEVGQRLLIPQPAPAPPAPDGITLAPQTVKQGDTLTITLHQPEVTSAQGIFDKQELNFQRAGATWNALAGISRCANYVGAYPVTLTLRDAQGNTSQTRFEVRVNAGAFGLQDLTLTSQMAALLDPALINAENARVGEIIGAFTSEQKWNGVFRLPLDVKNPRISTGFGERRSYNGGKPGLCGHEGTDYAVPGGTPVYAPAGGIVVLAEPLKVRGNVVFIDHGRGVFSAFYHLSEIVAQKGQRVAPGDLVGKVGSTGFSTGAHLHWSMWVNGVYVNPAQWMQEEIPSQK